VGYDTVFIGRVTITPPLNPAEITYLQKFADTRRMHRDNGPYYVDGTGYAGQGHDPDIRNHNRPDPSQPGLWCKWEPNGDGTAIEWNGVEKFYDATEWMRYLVDHFLKSDGHAKGQPGFEKFTFDHTVNGTINAEGEEHGDEWQLTVVDNVVTSTEQ
jgi:hypothetical protein